MSKINEIANLMPNDESKEDHLETILEIVSHLWNMLSHEQKQQLDHYRRAIGRANWAIMAKHEEPDLERVSSVAVRCILEMKARLESNWPHKDINDFAKNALYAIEKTGYDVNKVWD